MAGVKTFWIRPQTLEGMHYIGTEASAAEISKWATGQVNGLRENVRFFGTFFIEPGNQVIRVDPGDWVLRTNDHKYFTVTRKSFEILISKGKTERPLG